MTTAMCGVLETKLGTKHEMNGSQSFNQPRVTSLLHTSSIIQSARQWGVNRCDLSAMVRQQGRELLSDIIPSSLTVPFCRVKSSSETPNSRGGFCSKKSATNQQRNQQQIRKEIQKTKRCNSFDKHAHIQKTMQVKFASRNGIFSVIIGVALFFNSP